jgi:hypothetical protein
MRIREQFLIFTEYPSHLALGIGAPLNDGVQNVVWQRCRNRPEGAQHNAAGLPLNQPPPRQGRGSPVPATDGFLEYRFPLHIDIRRIFKNGRRLTQEFMM